MTMQGLVPTVDVGGSSGWGSSAAGAFGGALVGSWFGDGWGNRRYGYGEGAAVAATNVVADTAILDAIGNVATNVNSGNLAAIQGFGGLNSTVESTASATQSTINTTAFALQNALCQGFSGVNSTVQTGNAAMQNAVNQGFNGLNTAVLVSGKDAQLQTAMSTNAITSAIDACCCKTNQNILAQGCETRELIKDVQTQNLRDQLCDAKAKIAQGETVAQTTAIVDAKIAASTSTILAHLQALLSK